MLSNKQIPLVYSTNDYYCPITAVSLKSLLANANSQAKYDIYILATKLQTNNRRLLEDIVSDYPTASLTFVSMEKYIEKIGREHFYTSDYFSIEAYYRLFIPDILKSYDKVIYLDGDTVILDDIAKLYSIDIGQSWFGVTKDLGCQILGAYNFVVQDYFKRIKLPDINDYFQSGVLILNNKELRKNNMINLFSEKIKEIEPPLFWVDQDIFNLIAYKNVYFIDGNWDVVVNTLDQKNVDNETAQKLYRQFEDNFMQHPKIIHYCGKWWQFKDAPLSLHFWHFAKQVPLAFYHELLHRSSEITKGEELSKLINTAKSCRLKKKASKYRLFYHLSFGKMRQKYKQKYKKIKEQLNLTF